MVNNFLWNMLYIYTYYNKAEELVYLFCLNTLISGTLSYIWKFFFAFVSSILKEDYRLFKITLRYLGVEQKEKRFRKNVKWNKIITLVHYLRWSKTYQRLQCQSCANYKWRHCSFGKWRYRSERYFIKY